MKLFSWKSQPPRQRLSVSLKSHSRGRGFFVCRWCCRCPLLFICTFIIIVIWSLSWQDPFPYYSIASHQSSSSWRHSAHPQADPSYYWKKQHAQNDRACLEVARHLQTGGKVLLYNFTRPSNGPGMASLTINLLQIASFMEERWNRTHLVIDEELLENYRWDATHGLFGGYLYLPNRTCILTNTKEAVLSHAQTCNYWDVHCPVLEIDANPQGFMFEKARRVTKRYFMQQKPGADMARELRVTRFFYDLSRYASWKLPGLSLHPHVDNLVQQQQLFLVPFGVAKVPDAMTVESCTKNQVMDLAFHIRRGDKVSGARKESEAFYAQEYWNRFVNQSSQLLPTTTSGKFYFENCFVATDDYQVVSELQVVLQQRPQSLSLASKIIPCQHLWTLTPPNYTSTWQDREEIVGFLAQMRVLVGSKYFVGSFSSNVGGLVALLRGHRYHSSLRQDGMTHTEANRYRQFFDSYAVDWDEWGIL